MASICDAYIQQYTGDMRTATATVMAPRAPSCFPKKLNFHVPMWILGSHRGKSGQDNEVTKHQGDKQLLRLVPKVEAAIAGKPAVDGG